MTGSSFGVAMLAGAACASHEMAVIMADIGGVAPRGGAEIRAAPTGRIHDYATSETRQTSNAPGGTIVFDDGHECHGAWHVQAAASCSRWPPSDNRTCYDDTGRFEVRLHCATPGPDVCEPTCAS